jgi:hypothetical protein
MSTLDQNEVIEPINEQPTEDFIEQRRAFVEKWWGLMVSAKELSGTVSEDPSAALVALTHQFLGKEAWSDPEVFADFQNAVKKFLIKLITDEYINAFMGKAAKINGEVSPVNILDIISDMDGVRLAEFFGTFEKFFPQNLLEFRYLLAGLQLGAGVEN